MLEAEWRICSSDISPQAADMPCSNSVTFKIDFNFAAKTLNKPDLLASAVYHSGCIRRFLLHSTPLKVEFKVTEQSAHEVAFNCLISRISDDLFVHKKAFLMSHSLEIKSRLKLFFLHMKHKLLSMEPG
jgi:hypothetical protein